MNEARENTYKAIESLKNAFLEDYTYGFDEIDKAITKRSLMGWTYCYWYYPIQLWTPVVLQFVRQHYESEFKDVYFDDIENENGIQEVRVTIRW